MGIKVIIIRPNVFDYNNFIVVLDVAICTAPIYDKRIAKTIVSNVGIDVHMYLATNVDSISYLYGYQVVQDSDGYYGYATDNDYLRLVIDNFVQVRFDDTFLTGL